MGTLSPSVANNSTTLVIESRASTYSVAVLASILHHERFGTKPFGEETEGDRAEEPRQLHVIECASV